ncbi:hypothetical protein NP493_102g02006 [Ridgeia piscesae]|uniref:Uncharacterized protein n=1 Tax=Ridgeia piscesae TaxID=27915 RepID=A0AAD9P7M9_RIDPI|nr:hypothetical protein NP493_102g02006 [Ridgeia piscesae]
MTRTLKARPCPFSAGRDKVDSAMRGRSSQNQWSGWSDWSTCTLTCGQGTRMRRRDCVGMEDDTLVRREAAQCRGRAVEHYLCRLAGPLAVVNS